MMIALKSSSDDSSICVVLLASIDCLFLVLGMTSDFSVVPLYFGYHETGLPKSSALADLLRYCGKVPQHSLP